MPIFQHPLRHARLSAERIDAWRSIPPAIASDCMNRTQTMEAAIKPLARGMALCGQARTVECMVGDNSAIHAAVRLLQPGDVLVIDAGGYPDVAVFGGLLTAAAMQKRAAGVVIHGAVRDCAEIIDLGFAVYASATVPTGPHKGFGGTLDGVICCGGCPVSPGDIVLGDDDGVAIVPLAREAGVMQASLEKIAQEQDSLKRLKAGESMADQLGIAAPTVIS